MIIETFNTENGQITRVIASEGMRLTNSSREFYITMAYIPNESFVSNYEEVPRSIWKNFVEDDPADYKEQILTLQDTDVYLVENQTFVEEILLDTDFRLLQLELAMEYPPIK